MAFWSRFFRRREKDGSTAGSPAQWFVDWVRGGERTYAGVSVSPESAMRTAAVWACVKLRSEDIGKIPCLLYRRLADGGKERAVDHPYFQLIRDEPNPRMTAFEFRQLMQAQVDLRGNAYALKEIDANGVIIALWPVNPDFVTILQTPDGRELFYKIQVPGQNEFTVPGEAIVHLRGLTLDGKVGLSPIAHHRQTIGIVIAAQKYGAAFFGNNAQPMGGLKVPSPLSKEAAAALRESWKARHLGKNELGIFDGGLEWVQTGMNNADAQYIEALKFQNSDIWRIYRVPPHKAQDLDHATYSNIEQQSLEYVTDCLLTEMVRWEQTLRRDLLSQEEKKTYFFEFLPDALLRGDQKSRFEAYATAINWGILNPNECRELENKNHRKGGDLFLQPLNMIEAGTKPPPVSAPSPAAAKALIAYCKEIIARHEAGIEFDPAELEELGGAFGPIMVLRPKDKS